MRKTSQKINRTKAESRTCVNPDLKPNQACGAASFSRAEAFLRFGERRATGELAK